MCQGWASPSRMTRSSVRWRDNWSGKSLGPPEPMTETEHATTTLVPSTFGLSDEFMKAMEKSVGPVAPRGISGGARAPGPFTSGRLDVPGGAHAVPRPDKGM